MSLCHFSIPRVCDKRGNCRGRCPQLAKAMFTASLPLQVNRSKLTNGRQLLVFVATSSQKRGMNLHVNEQAYWICQISQTRSLFSVLFVRMIASFCGTTTCPLVSSKSELVVEVKLSRLQNALIRIKFSSVDPVPLPALQCLQGNNTSCSQSFFRLGRG